MITEMQGRVIVPGSAEGAVLASTEPLSFWGGYDQVTGEIIDRRHPLSGSKAAGTILVLPFTRGSSTTTAIFLESVRAGVAPAALITDRADVFLALASAVADEMYQKPVAMVAVSSEDFAELQTAKRIRLDDHGTVHVLD